MVEFNSRVDSAELTKLMKQRYIPITISLATRMQHKERCKVMEKMKEKLREVEDRVK